MDTGPADRRRAARGHGVWGVEQEHLQLNEDTLWSGGPHSYDNQNLPTDERLMRAAEGIGDPLLAELLFRYGRYLMISSSRPGTQPLNLQGIWNGTINPPWGSNYTININIQMNYWAAEVCNLSECHEPLLRMVGELQEPGMKTAALEFWHSLHPLTDGKGVSGIQALSDPGIGCAGFRP